MKRLFNKMPACVSIIIAIAMLCTGTFVSAQGEEVVVYKQIDISDYATGKFWADPTNTNELSMTNYAGNDWSGDGKNLTNGGYVDFISTMGGITNPKAAIWPPRLGKYNATNNTINKATISTEDSQTYNILTERGVSYKMPAKTSTADAKEAIVLSSANINTNKTVAIGDKANKVYFIIASAFSRTMTYTVDVVYKNSGYTQEPKEFTICDYTEANAVADETSVFLLDDYERLSSSNKLNSAGDWGGEMILYEHSVDIQHPDAEVKEIKFTATNTVGIMSNGSQRTANFAVVAITTEADWTAKIAAAEELISEAVNDNTDADKVLAAISAVDEIKKAGLDTDAYISNISEFNELFGQGAGFADVLIQGVYNGKTVSWANTEELLNQTVSIIEAIGGMGIDYTELSEETGAIAENAFSEMIDIMLAETVGRDEILERFDVLKNTGVSAFESIFADRLIWTESYSLDVDSELITFELDFSRSVPAEKLTGEYIKVTRGDAAVPDALVTYVPKYDGEDITGVTVKVINSFEYAEPYTLSIDNTFTGVSGGVWAYEDIYTEEISAPYAVNTEGLSVTETSVTGTMSLTNSTGANQSYVVMTAAYTKEGMLIDYDMAEGTVAAGATADTPEISLDIPESTYEIISYILDGYDNINLLCTPCKLK